MATSNNSEIKPDHIIVWLDKNMSEHRSNRTSKMDLATNANPDHLPSNKCSLDIDNFIQTDTNNIDDAKFNELIKRSLEMFTDDEQCITYIRDNLKAKKQPFLIASGKMGSLIVPKIYEELSGFIYIFCGQRNVHKWTDKYSQHLVVYDDEKGFFAKVLADIGIYYFKKSEEEMSNQIQYLRWARRLFIRASKLDRINRDVFLNLVNDVLIPLEASQSNNNDDDKLGADPDEG